MRAEWGQCSGSSPLSHSAFYFMNKKYYIFVLIVIRLKRQRIIFDLKPEHFPLVGGTATVTLELSGVES